MSFGWSAGDIAAAVTLVVRLIEVLDSRDGAAGEYREAVDFLQDLKCILEPLRTFTAWNTYPTYGGQIKDQVEQIKEPIESFLDAVRKYEPSLGAKATAALRHRNVVRKLQWYLFMSKKALNLKKKIQSNMRIIDSLMQRLTLEVLCTIQQQFPDNLRATFKEVVRPELIAVLQQNLLPISSEMAGQYQEIHERNHGMLMVKLSEHYEGLSSHITALKTQLNDSTTIQRRIECCIQDQTFRPEDRVQGVMLQEIDRRSSTSPGEDHVRLSCNAESEAGWEARWEALKEVLSILRPFSENLFLTLSRLLEPAQALMPQLLAKDNILFFDAIGGQRVLPYQYFRSFKVLRAFIQYEFRTRPGASWVSRGRYMIFSLLNNQVQDSRTWASITPGAKVAMSMVIRKAYNPALQTAFVSCPTSSCSGSWEKGETSSWALCPICHKEVLNSVLEAPADDPPQIPLDLNDLHDGAKPVLRNAIRGPALTSFGSKGSSILSREAIPEEDLDFQEDDIALFKRVVQQIIPVNELGLDLTIPSTSVSAKEAHSPTGRVDLLEHDKSDEMSIDEFHPLVERYLQMVEDLSLLEERLDDLLNEKTRLENKKEIRGPIGLKSHSEDQTWLDNSEERKNHLREQIGKHKKDIEIARKDCLARGLMIDVGEPIDFQAREQLSFDGEDDLNPLDAVSEYVKYPILIPHAASSFELPPRIPLDESRNTIRSRINGWMLDRLRTSALDVGLLARTFQDIEGNVTIDERWQIAVLTHWFLDGAARNAPRDLRVYTESMATQEPAIPLKAGRPPPTPLYPISLDGI